MATKSFGTLEVLGVITGLSLGEIGETTNLILWLSGHTYEELEKDRLSEVRSLDLDNLAAECQPSLKAQFPELAELKHPNIFSTSRSDFSVWEDEQVARFGPSLDVAAL